MKRVFGSIIKTMTKGTKAGSVVKALAVLVVFVTTYMLILPAFTLERDEAVRQGGIDIPAIETAAEGSSDDDAASSDSEAETGTEAQTEDTAKAKAKANEASGKETISVDSKAAAEAEAVIEDTASTKTKAENEAEAGNDSDIKAAALADPLTFEGEGFTVTVDDAKSVLPENTEVVASELLEKPEEGTKAERKEAEEAYKKYYELAQQAVKDEAGSNDARAISFVKFYDISLQTAGETVQPDKPVNVTITYDKDQQKELKVDEKKNVRIIHFAEDQKTGEITAELLKNDSVDVSLEKKQMAETTFEAGSFSVYGVVYTVDFSYEVDGKTYEYSIKGGEGIGLSELLPALGVIKDDKDTESDEVRVFIGQIEDVKFSDTGLVSVSKADSDTTVGGIKDALGLECEYSAELSDEQKEAINSKAIKAGDWALISLKAFDTEETLTITMKDGEAFDVKVTDAQEISDVSTLDPNMSYLISYNENGVYHVLKTDGTVETFTSTANFDKLGSDYQWTFYYVFTEKDRETSLDYTYYFARPIEQKTHTIALNEAGEELVQYGTNNIAIIPQDGGGFIFLGYNHTDDKHIELGFENGQFVAYNDLSLNPKIIRIYEQEPLQRYSFTVKTAEPSKGKVTGRNETGAVQTRVEQFIAESNDAKKNNTQITAVPETHGDGQGHNKWIFDYWDMNGIKLDGVGETISAGGIDIPANGSVLTAHFKQNPAYVAPDGEKEGTSIESMAAWLNELKNRNVPLDKDSCNKTAEVYDYENRVYRVDFTAKSSLSTFDGTIDLGFVLDVSGSMNFPSYLYDTNVTTGAKDLSTINDRDYWGQQTRGEREWGLDTRHTYYIIADPDGTATVCYLYYYDNNWWLCDASKDKYTGNGRFDPATGHSADNSQYYNNSYYKSTVYVIKEAGDRVTNADMASDGALLRKLGLNVGDPKTRAFYLEKSLNGTISELNEILDVLSIASTSNRNPDVKIAWNTFKNYLPNGNGQLHHDFTSVTTGINLNYDYNTYGGGTSTDVALLDAAGVNRNDVNNRYSDSDRKNWHTDNNVNHTYTLNANSGFRWENSSTKYAVLITDGAPQRNGKSITRRYVTEAAQQLKNRGVKLVTVGLGIENVTSGKILMYDIADSLNNEKMFYSAKTGDELEDVLLQIIRTIMVDATVQGDVTDVIDQAFYPVDRATARPLRAGEMVDLNGNVTTDTSKPHGIITYDESKHEYGVKWESQEITWDGWHGSVYVKAKEDLLGGNAVKTNDGNAIIEAKTYTTGTDSTPIPVLEHRYINDDPAQGEDPNYTKIVNRESPRVNVNELSFNGNDTEWTVYLGTEVDPKEQLEKLWEKIYVEEVVKEGKADDTDGDGLPDIGKANSGNTWYPIAPDSIADNREPDSDDAEAIAEYGDKQTFSINALIKTLAEASGRTEDYDWWDYTNHAPEWDTFLTQALTDGGIVIPYDAYSLNGNDNSTITIKLTKTILDGEEQDIVNSSPHDTTVVNGTATVEGKTVDVPVEKYNFTVLYSPDYSVVPVGQGGTGHLDYHTGTYGTIYQGHAAGTETSTNTHVINVYAKTVEVEKRKPADNDSTELLTDKPATFSIYRKWKSGDSTSSKASLAGYTLNGTPIGEPASDVDYYYLVESKQTTDGVARFTEGLSAVDGPYYLAETAAPEGYVENKVLQTVTITPGPDTKTDLDGQSTTAMPYNWEQGVKFAIDGTELTEEDGWFKTSVLNTPLTASLQLKKQVTINDFDIDHTDVEDKTEADGTYTINVAGKEGTATAGKSYTVKIIITNGVPASATIRDNTAAGPTDIPVTLTDGVLEISGMVPGEYTITEDPDSRTVLTAINSTDDSAYEDLENRSITVNLDGAAESVQLVTLTNNYADNSETDIAHVSVRKTFKGLKHGMTLPEDFYVTVKVTATIDGRQQVFNYTLTGATDTANGIIWNSSENDDGDIVWEWKIAIHGLTPDAEVEVQEMNYWKPGYEVSTSVNPENEGGDGTSYTGKVSPSTTVQSVASVITDKNSLVFPLEDKGTEQTIFIARIIPSQTSLVISKKKLNLSEKAALENDLRHMPNAHDWYNGTPPMYYTFEEAANNQIVVRNSSTVTYFEEERKGYIRFSKKAQWNMVATSTLTYVDGRPADVNFENSYTEKAVGIDIVKVDETQRTTTLPGAVFTLTKLDEATTPTHIEYKKIAGTDTLEKQETSDPTGEDGETSFVNLTGGYYEIKETTSPAGYVLQGDECFYVKIEDGVAKYLAVSDDADKPITEWEAITESDDAAKVQVTLGQADDPSTSGTDETAATQFSVGNTPGAELPHTGGIGTTIFNILGSILAFGCGIALISRRKLYRN